MSEFFIVPSNGHIKNFNTSVTYVADVATGTKKILPPKINTGGWRAPLSGKCEDLSVSGGTPCTAHFSRFHCSPTFKASTDRITDLIR